MAPTTTFSAAMAGAALTGILFLMILGGLAVLWLWMGAARAARQPPKTPIPEVPQTPPRADLRSGSPKGR